MRRTLLSAAALSVAALTLTQLAPATADGVGIADADDLAHGVDLLSVEVQHKAANVVVTTTHDDLRESFRSGSSGSVFIDTDPDVRTVTYVEAPGLCIMQRTDQRGYTTTFDYESITGTLRSSTLALR